MQGKCPICEANISFTKSVEVSEIITCKECQNQLEVTDVGNNNVRLKEAPTVEEDWGE